MRPDPPTVASTPRLLIFVAAYYAESTLHAVLERVPKSIFDEYDGELLIVDDGSEAHRVHTPTR